MAAATADRSTCYTRISQRQSACCWYVATSEIVLYITFCCVGVETFSLIYISVGTDI